jgi:hypothetical protein
METGNTVGEGEEEEAQDDGGDGFAAILLARY